MERKEEIAAIREEIFQLFGVDPPAGGPVRALPFISGEERHSFLTESRKLASLFDHTILKPETTPSMVEEICEQALRYGFYSACVNPVHVKRAKSVLEGSGVAVVSTAGFPLGGSHPAAKAFEAECSIKDGVDEIDMVMDVSAVKQDDMKALRKDIESVREVCGREIILKVIIEAAVLTDEEKIKACTVAQVCGADFVKTSTGFGPPGAAVGDVLLMREVVGEKMGVKASAGIRDLETVRAMIRAGANRIGCSASVRIMQELDRENKVK